MLWRLLRVNSAFWVMRIGGWRADATGVGVKECGAEVLKGEGMGWDGVDGSGSRSC